MVASSRNGLDVAAFIIFKFPILVEVNPSLNMCLWISIRTSLDFEFVSPILGLS